MIGNQTDGHIIERILLVRLSGQFTDLVADCFHRINVEYGIHILHDNRKTLKSHTGIDILLGKFSITTLAITLKLGKYVVPYFHKAVTVTADLAVRLTAAVFFSAVIIDLGARTAWTCAMLPEIVTLSGLGVTVESCDTLCRHTDFLRPDVERLVILPVDRRIKSVLLQSEHLCQKLPGPCDRFMLKIITKGKVAEHLKKGQMSCSLSYILNITGTDTLLAGRHSSSRRDLLSCKIRL